MKKQTSDRLKSRINITVSGCWDWTGSTNQSGYGTISFGNKNCLVHRVAFEEFCGEIPAGHEIRHRCHNRICINPEHLTTGTHKQNMNDMVVSGRSKYKTGVDNPRARLSESDVIAIRGKLRSGETLTGLALVYNVTPQNIYRIDKRLTWKHI